MTWSKNTLMSSESHLRPLPQVAFSLTATVTTVLPPTSAASSLVRKSGFGVALPSSAQSTTKGETNFMTSHVSTMLPSTVKAFQFAGAEPMPKRRVPPSWSSSGAAVGTPAVEPEEPEPFLAQAARAVRTAAEVVVARNMRRLSFMGFSVH